MNISRVQLPSRGILYEGKLPDGWIEIRPMTTREEKILLTPRRERASLAWKVIDQCLVTRDISLEEMLVGDKLFLLFCIRNATYGSSYAFSVTCPQCGSRLQMELNIPEDLELHVLDETDTLTFDVELPIANVVLTLRRLTGKDEKEVARYERSRPAKIADGDPGYIYRLSRHIVAIDGKEVDAATSLNFCEEMIAGDSAVMREEITACDCGISVYLNHECVHCGWEFEEQMPLTADFFRSSTCSHKRRHRNTSSI